MPIYIYIGLIETFQDFFHINAKLQLHPLDISKCRNFYSHSNFNDFLKK